MRVDGRSPDAYSGPKVYVDNSKEARVRDQRSMIATLGLGAKSAVSDSRTTFTTREFRCLAIPILGIRIEMATCIR